jgi:hypothetical protein
MPAIRPPDAQTEALATGVGQALGSLGDGITAVFKSGADQKRDQLKYERDKELARIKAQADADYRKQTLDETIRHNRASEESARAKIDSSAGGDYDEYLGEAGDRIIDVTPKAFHPKETPQYFPESKLELGAPSPQVDESEVSFNGRNNLSSLSAPIVMPPQEDQRYTALQNLGESTSLLRVASANGAGPSESTPNLPYSLQGGVPKALADLQLPNTRELYTGSEFAPTPIPTYGSTSQQPATANGAAPQPSRSPIVAFPVSDPNGRVLGYAYYDKASRKLIPGSYVAESKSATAPIADSDIPQGFRPKSMSVNAKGEKSYTYEPKISELSEGQARILNSLRDDYKSDAFIKAAQDAVGSLGIIEQSLSEQNGFGDIMAINAMQRMIDPGVAVREGDVRLIQDAIPRLQRMGLQAKNWFVGDQLTPEVRAQMLTLASKTADKRSSLANERSVPKFKQSAEKIGLDFNLVGDEFPVKSKKFQKEYIARQTELDSLIKEIDSSKDQNSTAILAKKEKARQLHRLQKQ